MECGVSMAAPRSRFTAPAGPPGSDAPNPGVALLPLFTAVAIALGATVYPQALVDAGGRVDHGAVTFAFWSMSAGFVRGVGFVPRGWVWRWLFSGWACAISLALSMSLRWA